MKLFLGIDGGGTHSRAFLADESGRIIAKGAAGTSNPSHASDEQLRHEFQTLLNAAFSQAKAGPEQCVSAFGGIAGVTCASTAERIISALKDSGLTEAKIGIDHDIRIALAGGLGGAPGIALIVGTGSSCYGRNSEGRTWQSGGWGSLIADEGSGHFLGHQAIVAAARMADGRLPASGFMDAVFSWLGIKDVAEILNRLYEVGIERHEIAAFAPQVIKFAEAGDAAAIDILDRGASELAFMVAANHTALPTSAEPAVAITGGLGTADTIYRGKIIAAIRAQVPSARIPDLFMSPTAGAVMLAFEQVEGRVRPEVLEAIRGSSQ